MNRTKIQYLTHTWSPIVMKCDRVSKGCLHCWHLKRANMLSKNYKISDDYREIYAGKKPPEIAKHRLDMPLRRKAPSRIGVQLMGDLFHESIPFDWIAAVMGVIAFCNNHKFLVLTKRPGRMKEFFNRFHDGDYERNYHWWLNEACYKLPVKVTEGIRLRERPDRFPLPNLQLGVSISTQEDADKWIPELLETPAAARVLSIEPLLEFIDLTPPEHRGTNLNNEIWLQGLDWIVLGGETGWNARPMHPHWVQSIRDRCINRTDMGRPWPLPFFFKSWGEWSPTFGRRDSRMRICRGGRVEPSEYTEKTLPNRPFFMFGTEYVVGRCGNKIAGNVIDGQTWEEYPK